jgi:hypothetical protein
MPVTSSERGALSGGYRRQWHHPTAYEEEETMFQKQYQRVFGDEYNQESLLNKTASREVIHETIVPRGRGKGMRRGRFWIVLIVLLALAAVAAAVFMPWLFKSR